MKTLTEKVSTPPAEDAPRAAAFSRLRELAAWVPVPLLVGEWLFARLRAVSADVDAPPSEPGRSSVMCIAGDDFASRLDSEVARSTAAEILVTRREELPDPRLASALRERLSQPGVWLACARSGWKNHLGGRERHRENESGSFCVAAPAEVWAFRRDVYLKLGGLAAVENQAPGLGLPALSLLGWLRGYKTVYAGDIDFGASENGAAWGENGSSSQSSAAEFEQAAALTVAAVDHLPTLLRRLHRQGRDERFRKAFRQAAVRLKPPRVSGGRNRRLLPLVEQGAQVFRGRSQRRAMRVAVVTPFIPDPLGRAGASRVFNLLRGVADDCEIHLFSYANGESDRDIDRMLEFCRQVVLVAPSRNGTPAAGCFLPPGVGRYRTPAMKAYLKEFTADFQIPLVQAESSHLAFVSSWLANSAAKKILVEHDVTFDRRRRALEGRSGWERVQGGFDAGRWKRYELGQIRHFDRVVIASDDDRRRLADHRVEETKLSVIANGVDLDRFRPMSSAPLDDSVLFAGSFSHFPNVLAFRLLLEDIWPRIVSRRPGCRLIAVAGEGYAESWKRHTGRETIEWPDGVEVTAAVGDPRLLYEACRVVVVPPPICQGADNTVLEALAAGRPVVSSASGCSGLGLESGKNVLIADDPESFAQAAARLLDDGGLCNRIARAGRRHAEAHFGWKTLAAKQLRLYEELLRGKQPIQ